MPFADNRNKPWVLEQLTARVGVETIREVVDVGAGAGSNLEFYGPWFERGPVPEYARWTAIEAWEPYVERFVLSRYARVIVADVRQIAIPVCDVVFLGDVLEHLTHDEALDVWLRARTAARWVVLSLPVVHYEQGAWEGNPFEVHLHHWDTESVLAELDGIEAMATNETTGAFIAQGIRS
jgi:trans-aconitate methyltransferase